MTEILGELRKGVQEIGGLSDELLSAIEDIGLKLTVAYRTETKKKEQKIIWEETKKLERILAGLNILFETRAETLLGGYWARYYLLRKFYPDDEEAIADLAKRVDDYFEGIDSEAYPGLFVAWGYLFATVMGELKGDSGMREEVNKVIYPLSVKKGLIKPIAQATNSRVLEAMADKDFQGAIEIADKFARDLLDEAVEDPEAILNAANILSNCGLARINLSDTKKGGEREEILRKAVIFDFWEAEKIYEMLDPPNLDHFNGLINRLILAAIKLLHAYGEMETEQKKRGGLCIFSQRIQDEFSNGNRAGARKIIEEALTFCKSKRMNSSKIESLVFLKQILVRIDQFLERYKE